MASRLHTDLILKLCVEDISVKTHRFRKNVLEAVGNVDVEHRAWLHSALGRVYPDAHKVQGNTVTCYEAEVTHPVQRGRLDLYADIAWALDQVHWEFELFVLDGYDSQLRRLDTYELMYTQTRVEQFVPRNA